MHKANEPACNIWENTILAQVHVGACMMLVRMLGEPPSLCAGRRQPPAGCKQEIFPRQDLGWLDGSRIASSCRLVYFFSFWAAGLLASQRVGLHIRAALTFAAVMLAMGQMMFLQLPTHQGRLAFLRLLSAFLSATSARQTVPELVILYNDVGDAALSMSMT